MSCGCRFTHDAIRSGNTVWVCSTGTGAILELQYPEMVLRRTLQLFTLREHVNTIAAVGQTTLWVVLHNLGKVRCGARSHARAIRLS